MMKTRITFQEINPILYESLAKMDQYAKSVLDPRLCELIKFRVSQINSCAYCLDMHHKEAISLGEEELRLHTLPAWRECSHYSNSERAALEFAEAITEPSKYGLSDDTYLELAKYFDKEMIMALTVVVLHINSWNRINHVSRPLPGKYKVGQFNNK
ncbi:carboxymuconolactone decarboxylase family protein [Belliella marina]|uniref:Carboxymuconolactone decarboxylase family protein n=1 Tax=Belliella marina TaxID=1644146 RepID=A0ABW4VSR0_9BACT